MIKFVIVDIKGIMEALTIHNKVIQFKTLSIFKDRVFCSLEIVKIHYPLIIQIDFLHLILKTNHHYRQQS